LNQEKNIIIIGCGAGGGTAAQFARKTDRKANITVFEKGKYSQYSKCGLPYTISGKIPNTLNLVEFSEEWFKKANIDLLLETTVEKIDMKNKKIYAKKEKNDIEKPFNKLIICTGAKPIIPQIKNIDVDGVFVVRTIEDIKKIKDYTKKSKKAIIIGAGLIGLEMADNLHKIDFKITLIEALPNILVNNLDSDMAKIVAETIPADIKVYTSTLASQIVDKDGEIAGVVVKNKETSVEKTIETDMLIIATGTKPDIELAKHIGCKIGSTGGIIVNNKSETNIKDVYAVGDCTEFFDFVSGKSTLIGLGSIAVRQGIAAGINAASGEYALPRGVLMTSTSEFFGIEIASVGPISSNLSEFTVASALFNGSSLPEYYPGGQPISIKVMVDEYTGMIMAAQAVGDKAAQRINTFATAILGKMDIETFRKLETAYAPPIAPTLDALTLVCDIISMKQSRKK
jgi:NADH oxidase (H2O2-forming)